MTPPARRGGSRNAGAHARWLAADPMGLAPRGARLGRSRPGRGSASEADDACDGFATGDPCKAPSTRTASTRRASTRRARTEGPDAHRLAQTHTRRRRRTRDRARQALRRPWADPSRFASRQKPAASCKAGRPRQTEPTPPAHPSRRSSAIECLSESSIMESSLFLKREGGRGQGEERRGGGQMEEGRAARGGPPPTCIAAWVRALTVEAARGGPPASVDL